jgi:hypothetical protein
VDYHELIAMRASTGTGYQGACTNEDRFWAHINKDSRRGASTICTAEERVNRAPWPAQAIPTASPRLRSYTEIISNADEAAMTLFNQITALG